MKSCVDCSDNPSGEAAYPSEDSIWKCKGNKRLCEETWFYKKCAKTCERCSMGECLR